MKLKTTKKNWTVHGINLIPSDAIYQKLQKAIEEGELSQQHLQKITGHNSPILVDEKKSSIQFLNF